MSTQDLSTQKELSWEEWTASNIARGCDREDLRRILRDNGFDAGRAAALTDGNDPIRSDEPAPVTQERAGPDDLDASPGLFLPGALRIDTDEAEIYGIDGFLSSAECMHLIALIRRTSRPSTTTDEGVSEFRTSRTCELASLDDPLVADIDRRICRYMGIDPAQSEPIEGQWYDEGQQFKPHTDYFEPASASYEEHLGEQGQRSWTFMIYLNTTRSGGETHFPELDATFSPRAGTAVIWNNRDGAGALNPATLHHGMPVRSGFKAIVTKWFRSTGPSPTYLKEPNEYLPPLTEHGFLKASMPTDLHATLLDYYRSRRTAATGESIPDFISSESGEAPSVLVELTDELRHQVHLALQPIVEAWIGDYLEPTYVYGIREYRRGSVLAVHRDRLETHVASAILNIDKAVESDWPLLIEDHQYRPTEVMLEPGQMVLYEGARLAHGRPLPLDGDRYANVFVHLRRRDE